MKWNSYQEKPNLITIFPFFLIFLKYSKLQTLHYSNYIEWKSRYIMLDKTQNILSKQLKNTQSFTANNLYTRVPWLSWSSSTNHSYIFLSDLFLELRSCCATNKIGILTANNFPLQFQPYSSRPWFYRFESNVFIMSICKFRAFYLLGGS